MLSKYNIRDAATRRVTDRQTDRMFWYNNTICIIVQYKVKSSPAKKKQDHHCLPVSTYHSRTVCLAQRAIWAGDEIPIIGVVDIHQHEAGLAHEHSKSAPRRQRRRRAERRRKTTSAATSKKTSPRRRVEIIGVVDNSGIHSPWSAVKKTCPVGINVDVHSRRGKTISSTS